MQGSSTVTEYLDRLVRELSFDIPLSRRARSEVEDHLWEAIANDPSGDASESQRRAIARFGDPREIARQYAGSSLAAQTRRVGLISVLALTGMYIAMKGRGTWYGLVQWGLSDHVKGVYAIGVSFDRYAFMIALAIGIIGWSYVGIRRAPGAFQTGYRKQAKHCVMFCTATAGALLASVILDTILTGLRLSEATLSASALVPVLSMAAEFALMSVLVVDIRTTIRRTAFVSSLLSS